MAGLYLIDGSFELFRCYYGAPKAQLYSGEEVAAVRTLFRSLAALLRQPEGDARGDRLRRPSACWWRAKRATPFTDPRASTMRPSKRRAPWVITALADVGVPGG